MTKDSIEQYAKIHAKIAPEKASYEDKVLPPIIWYILRIAKHAEQELEFTVHRPRGWSWAGFRVMFNTWALGSSRPSELASIIGVTRPTITVLLTRLERDGLIKRAKIIGSGGGSEVTLTEQGEQAVREGLPRQLEVEEKMLSHLEPRKQKQLRKLLHELYEGFQMT